jgi:hypothetical protein
LARSTWIATRFSFSSARCLRRLNLPSPAASSTSSRRSSGALHATVEVDQEIPSEHYRAVAEVIGYVMRLRRGAGN